MRERSSDLLGFLAFSALAVWTAVRMPSAGILLAPTLAHEIFAAFAFLLRDRVRLCAPTAASRLAAYGGTFFLVGYLHAARLWRPEWILPTRNSRMLTAGLLLWLVGLLTALLSLFWLRHSFSIEPQARRLVTSGPYAFARHPIYTSYAIHYAGLWLVYPSVAFAAVMLGWFALTVMRMHFEERVLSAAFVEYPRYRQMVGALGPRLSVQPASRRFQPVIARAAPRRAKRD